MVVKSNRISIKVRRNVENSLRQIAVKKNKTYAGRGSIACLIEAVGLGEIPLLPMTEMEELPAIPAIFFCTNQNGKILYISKSINLKQRWRNNQLELQNLIANDAVGIFWIPVNPDTMDATTEQLIKYLEPELNNNSNSVTFSSQDYYIDVGEEDKINLTQQRSLHRAFVALIEKRNYSDARILLKTVENHLPATLLNQMQSMLSQDKENWLQKIEKLITERTSFVLLSGNNRHHCKYAEIWENDGQTYLRCWVENILSSNEPSELAHNRVYSLDNAIRIEPFPQSFWRYEGLDSLEVTLHLHPSLRYKPKPDDLLCRFVTMGHESRIEVVKKIYSIFWFFQSLQRYGEKVTIVKPDFVKQRFVSHLNTLLDLYIVR